VLAPAPALARASATSARLPTLAFLQLPT